MHSAGQLSSDHIPGDGMLSISGKLTQPGAVAKQHRYGSSNKSSAQDGRERVRGENEGDRQLVLDSLDDIDKYEKKLQSDYESLREKFSQKIQLVSTINNSSCTSYGNISVNGDDGTGVPVGDRGPTPSTTKSVTQSYIEFTKRRPQSEGIAAGSDFVASAGSHSNTNAASSKTSTWKDEDQRLRISTKELLKSWLLEDLLIQQGKQPQEQQQEASHGSSVLNTACIMSDTAAEDEDDEYLYESSGGHHQHDAGDIGLLHALLTKDLIDNYYDDGGDDSGSAYGDYDYAYSDDDPDNLDGNYFANIANTQSSRPSLHNSYTTPTKQSSKSLIRHDHEDEDEDGDEEEEKHPRLDWKAQMQNMHSISSNNSMQPDGALSVKGPTTSSSNVSANNSKQLYADDQCLELIHKLQSTLGH